MAGVERRPSAGSCVICHAALGLAPVRPVGFGIAALRAPRADPVGKSAAQSFPSLALPGAQALLREAQAH